MKSDKRKELEMLMHKIENPLPEAKFFSLANGVYTDDKTKEVVSEETVKSYQENKNYDVYVFKLITEEDAARIRAERDR